MSEGATLGKYRLQQRIAKGGMGEVFLARQEGVRGFSKVVVVKRILDHLTSDKQFTEMFINEARLAALLSHPNVVQVFDLGEDDGALYIAMEYVHGHSLRAIGKALHDAGRLMPMGLAAKICSQALRGLHYAHTVAGEDGVPLKLVHRDVSADNVLVGFDGSVKLVDFGVAKATALTAHTSTGMVKGKIAYMSPEQLKGERLDGRADLYAMGVVLYELLSGKRPFRSNSDTGLMMAILKEEPPPLKEVAPRVDPLLAAITTKALQKDRQRRYESAEQMADDLEQVAARLDLGGGAKKLLIELFGEESASPPVLTPSKGNLPMVDVNLETRSAAKPRLVEPTRSAVVPSTGSEPVEAPKNRRLFLLAGAAVLAGATAFTGVFMLLRGAQARTEPAPVVVAHEETPPAEPPRRAPEPTPPTAAPALVPAPATVAPPTPTPARRDPVQPAPAANGLVELVVLPWGEVRLGKRLLGVTPMEPVSLPAGAQVLTVTNPDLGKEKKVRVLVPAGGTAHLKVDLME